MIKKKDKHSKTPVHVPDEDEEEMEEPEPEGEGDELEEHEDPEKVKAKKQESKTWKQTVEENMAITNENQKKLALMMSALNSKLDSMMKGSAPNPSGQDAEGQKLLAKAGQEGQGGQMNMGEQFLMMMMNKAMGGGDTGQMLAQLGIRMLMSEVNFSIATRQAMMRKFTMAGLMSDIEVQNFGAKEQSIWGDMAGKPAVGIQTDGSQHTTPHKEPKRRR